MEHPYHDLPDVGPICLARDHPVLSSHETSSCHDAALDALLDGLRQLRTDHTSGAKELATQAVASLVQVATSAANYATPPDGEQVSATADEWWEATRRAAWAISRYGRPSMGAAITVAVVSAMDHARAGLSCENAGELSDASSSKSKDGDRIQHALRRMQDYLQQRSRGAQSTPIGTKLRQFVLQNFQHRVDEAGRRLTVKILTLSSSSTVRQALMTFLGTAADDEHLEVVDLRIVESRPLCEGVDLAKALVKYTSENGLANRLRIEIASDASVAILARDADLVLLGADRISGTGDVSNKTGSLPAVLCAKAVSHHVSVVVVSELEKIAKPGGIEEHGEEDNDVEEVTSAWNGRLEDLGGAGLEAWNRMVAARNVYFEWVPAAHIDCYICEEGQLDADGIRTRSEWVLQAETELFGELDESGKASASHGNTYSQKSMNCS